MTTTKNDHNGHGPFRAVQPYMTQTTFRSYRYVFASNTFINCMLNITGGN